MNLDIVDEEQAGEKVTEEVALSLKERIDYLMVVDQASYDLANAINAEAYEKRKAFLDWFGPIDEASKKQRQATIAQGKKVTEPLDYVIQTTGKRSAAWMAEETRKANEAKRAAEAEERRKAEENAMKEAEALHDSGLESAAEARLEQDIVIPKVTVDEPVKATGTSVRTIYSAEGVDLMTLVRAVAEGKAPLTAVDFNMTFLNGWARLTKGTEKIPGVRVNLEYIQARRS